jgi:hypothetical protein
MFYFCQIDLKKKKVLLLAKIQPHKIWNKQLLKREKNELNMLFLPN